ncbi:MAG: hypothetical protein Q9185_002298 [Variospora sp. 1 TL-2023]
MSTASCRTGVQTGTNQGFQQFVLKSPWHHHRPESKRPSDKSGTEVSSNAANGDAFTSLAKLRSEKMTVHASIHDLEAQIEMTSRSRPNGNSVGILHALTETLQEDIAALRHHVEAYKDADPRCVEEKREGTEAMRFQAERWTNNIEILEGWLCEVIGTEQMDRLREECYGADYVEGEGLGDL